MSLCSEVLGNQSCENGVYFIPVRVSKMLDAYLILTLLITGHDFVAYSHNENIRLYVRDSRFLQQRCHIGLLGCDATLSFRWLPTSQRNIFPSPPR
jgi:hypothetical protein